MPTLYRPENQISTELFKSAVSKIAPKQTQPPSYALPFPPEFDEREFFGHLTKSATEEQAKKITQSQPQQIQDWYERHQAKEQSQKVLANLAHEMAMRRMVRWASERDYDKVAWPATPDQVATIEGGRDFKKVGESYFVGNINVTPIVNRYLEDIPRYMNQFGKKCGVRVEKQSIPISPYPEYNTINTFDITPAMRKSAVEEGLPLFQLAPPFTTQAWFEERREKRRREQERKN